MVAYDGSGFHGFAAQPGQRTVAGELTRAISNFARHPVELVCAGRTDTGVHAFGQVVHVDLASEVDLPALGRAVNRQLSPAVVVRSAEVVGPDFDARRCAVRRSYRYMILVSESPDPLLARLAWHLDHEIELRSMRAAADALLGEHDFSAFCRRPPGHPADAPITRRVLDAQWTETPYFGGGVAWAGGGAAWAGGGARAGGSAGAAGGEASEIDPYGRLLRFDISATSFCHQMVRSVVGTLVEVGRGRMKPADVPRLLASRDRSEAKSIAPPHGLCLMSVVYGD